MTVTLKDNFGNVITGYVGTVHFTSTDGQAVLPADYTFTSADQGKHTFQVTFDTTGTQSVSVTDTTNSALTAAAGAASVTTSAQLLVLTGLGQTATAGTPQSVTVTLKDNFGNVVTNYVGTVHFTSTDGQAALPANYKFTAGDQGTHTFQVTFKTAGSQSISVTDTANKRPKGGIQRLGQLTSAQLVVLSGLAQTATAGSPQSVTVTLKDNFWQRHHWICRHGALYQHRRPSCPPSRLYFHKRRSGQAYVPSHFRHDRHTVGQRHRHGERRSQGYCQLLGHDFGSTACRHRYRTNRYRGCAAKRDCHLDRQLRQRGNQLCRNGPLHQHRWPGRAARRLHFYCRRPGQTHLPSHLQDYGFAIAQHRRHYKQCPDEYDQCQCNQRFPQLLVIIGFPDNHATAGSPQSITVAVTDTIGNAITGYVGTVLFTSTDAQAVLPVDYTFTTADQGKHTFQVTFDTTGTQSVSVTDTANSALKATASASVTTSAQLVVLTGLGQTAMAGAPQSVTVTLKDNFGNVVTNYMGAVHFTSTDGQAVLPADYTFTSADQGQHAFQVTFKTAGSQSVSVTDTVNSALKATSNVSVTTSAQLVVLSGLAQTATAGSQQSVTVTLKDNFGNVITGYVGTVHFTSTDGQAVLPADYTFTSADQGKHTFQVTFDTTGTQSVSVTDTANSALTATASASVTSSAQLIVLSGLGQTATAGTPQSVTVTLKDNFGNVITGFVGSVHFNSTDGHAVLPVDYAFTSADQGKHTFQVTFDITKLQFASVNTKNSPHGNRQLQSRVRHHRSQRLGQTATAGTPQSVTVTLKDNFGNVITGYVGTVHFTSTDSQAVLPADYTFTTADQGKHTFPVTLDTAGTIVSQRHWDTTNNVLKATANTSVTSFSLKY